MIQTPFGCLFHETTLTPDVCVLVWGNCIPYLVCVTVLPAPSNLSPPVLAELVQADLITSVEFRGLRYPSDVVAVQKYKSPEVLTKTADILLRHGFEEESKLITGKQTAPHPCTCGVLYSGA